MSCVNCCALFVFVVCCVLYDVCWLVLVVLFVLGLFVVVGRWLLCHVLFVVVCCSYVCVVRWCVLSFIVVC